MRDRFYLDNPVQGDQAFLDGAQAHHLHHVLRKSIGDEVTLFDGRGCEMRARVDQLGRSKAVLTVLETHLVDREARRCVVVGVAMPKGDRQRWLVEKLVEIGVSCLVPLGTEYAGPQARVGRREKLRRAIIESSKQCGRNRLMELAAGEDLTTFLQRPPNGATRLMADPTGCDRWSVSTMEWRSPCFLAIGPEGGFSRDEVSLARRHRWEVVQLGHSILRIETASVLLAGWACSSAIGAERTDREH